MGSTPASQTTVLSPSLPPLGGSQLPGQQLLVCLSTPAFHTPFHHHPPHTHRPTRVEVWLLAEWREQCQGLCRRSALATFIMFSVPLCSQAPSGSSMWFAKAPCIFISASPTEGVKKPLQWAEHSFRASCFQLSNPCCLCLKDPVLCG